MLIIFGCGVLDECAHIIKLCAITFRALLTEDSVRPAWLNSNGLRFFPQEEEDEPTQYVRAHMYTHTRTQRD